MPSGPVISARNRNQSVRPQYQPAHAAETFRRHQHQKEAQCHHPCRYRLPSRALPKSDRPNFHRSLAIVTGLPRSCSGGMPPLVLGHGP